MSRSYAQVYYSQCWLASNEKREMLYQELSNRFDAYRIMYCELSWLLFVQSDNGNWIFAMEINNSHPQCSCQKIYVHDHFVKYELRNWSIMSIVLKTTYSVIR